MRPSHKPTIVHVVNSLEGGGTERTLVALLRRFDPARGRHVVLTLREAGALASRLPDHTACRVLGVTGPSRIAWLRLLRALHGLRPSIVHARNTGCWWDAVMVCSMRRHTALVLGFHGLDSEAMLDRARRRAARVALRIGGRFTSVSHAGLRQVRDEARVPPGRIDVLPNGVDTALFRDGSRVEMKASIRRQFGIDDSALMIGTVGSLTPVKGHAHLFGAFARLSPGEPNLHLLIVGHGPLRDTLADFARARGLQAKIHFAGWREDVPKLLAALDVYVCPSIAEGMSNAVLEAMAAGLPIIATDCGDNAAMVRDGVEGRIVAAGSPHLLAAALAELVRDSEARRRFGQAAGERAAAYDFDRTVASYEDYYAALAGGIDARRGRRRHRKSGRHEEANPAAERHQASPREKTTAPPVRVSTTGRAACTAT